MTDLQKKDLHAVTGSIYDIAFRGDEQVESVIADAEIVILIDTSSSMNTQDNREAETRYDHACRALREIQQAHQGKVLLVSFNTYSNFCLDGVPDQPSGQTILAPALELVKDFAGTGMKFIVISDGALGDHSRAIEAARRLGEPIDTIYIGPEGGHGEDAMRELARITQGTTAGRVEPKMLGSRIAGLLGGGS